MLDELLAVTEEGSPRYLHATEALTQWIQTTLAPHVMHAVGGMEENRAGLAAAIREAEVLAGYNIAYDVARTGATPARTFDVMELANCSTFIKLTIFINGKFIVRI
jgi:hypothetical protein